MFGWMIGEIESLSVPFFVDGGKERCATVFHFERDIHDHVSESKIGILAESVYFDDVIARFGLMLLRPS